MDETLKKIIFIGILILLISTTSKINAEAKIKADTVKIGLFVMSVYDLKLPEKEYSISFWIWILHKNDSLNVKDHIEIINSKSVEILESFKQKKNGWNYTSAKYNVVMQQKWNTESFPFDKQSLTLRLEDSEYDSRSVIFIADTIGSKFNKKSEIQGFEITGFEVKSAKSVYDTNYGEPSLKEQKSEYSAIDLHIDIQRISGGLYWKLFLGLYISLGIALLTFLVSPSDIDARFGLAVGALFAAVGNKYIVDSILPENASFSLADKIHALTFAFIFLTIMISALSRYYDKKNKIKISKKIDRIALFILPLIFALLNFILLWSINKT